MSRNDGSLAPAATPYSSGLRSPSRRPPFSSMYWSITAVIPAQIGAACEVPPPTRTCWLKTIFTPVKASATAETSGMSRRFGLVAGSTACCHDGRSNSDETPPPVPCDSGTSTQACSAIQPPWSFVVNVVPPTLVISGTDATASNPTSSSDGGDDQSWPP